MPEAQTVSQSASSNLWIFKSVGVSFPETDENSKRPSILERSRDNSIFRKYSVTDDSIVWPILSHNDTGQGISILHVVLSSENNDIKIFSSEPSLKFKWFNLYGSTSIVSISVKNRIEFISIIHSLLMISRKSNVNNVERCFCLGFKELTQFNLLHPGWGASVTLKIGAKITLILSLICHFSAKNDYLTVAFPYPSRRRFQNERP